MFETCKTSAPWQHKQAGQTETVEALIRRAHMVLRESGVVMSPSKVSRSIRQRVKTDSIGSASRMITAYTRAPRESFESFCLTYSDITGETAARNVDRERRAVTR